MASKSPSPGVTPPSVIKASPTQALTERALAALSKAKQISDNEAAKLAARPVEKDDVTVFNISRRTHIVPSGTPGNPPISVGPGKAQVSATWAKKLLEDHPTQIISTAPTGGSASPELASAQAELIALRAELAAIKGLVAPPTAASASVPAAS